MVQGAYSREREHSLANLKIVVWNGHFTGIKKYFLNFFGCIPIENNKSVGNTKSISDFLNKEEKFKFCISPEGSRDYRDRFRSGFFHIAQQTRSVYNITLFDYERHTIHFGHLLESTGNLRTDTQLIASLFSQVPPLYPENTFYFTKNYSFTSCIDWICVSNLIGLCNSLLMWEYYHPIFSFLCLLTTSSSFLYHNSKEMKYRLTDWICSIVFLVSFVIYRLHFGFYKIGIVFAVWLLFFSIPGHCNRFTNGRYRRNSNNLEKTS